MYYCKELFSLSVLSLYEGELLGVVDKLFFDKKLKKLLHIVLVGANGAKLVLPVKNIYNIGKNAITVKNNQAVMFNDVESESVLAPINLKAYSINGEYLGVVEEIELNERFETEKISLDNNLILKIENFASCGQSTIIFNNSEEKLNIKKFEPNKMPKKLKTKQVQVATILPMKENVNKIEVGQSEAKSANVLLGRVCLKDIINFNNEVLIKAQELVTKKNLKEINKYGKLRELMLYLK